MKKNLYLLLASFLLASCGTNNDSNLSELQNGDSISSVSEEILSSIESNNSTESNTIEEEINNITFDNEYTKDSFVTFMGKTYFDGNKVVFSQSNTYFEIAFEGTQLKAKINANPESNKAYINIYIDGETDPQKASKLKIDSINEETVLVDNLPYGNHTVRVYKINEASYNKIYVKSLSTDGKFIKKTNRDKIKIEFFGDSISCGFGSECINESDQGTEDNENSNLTYIYYASTLLNADFQQTSASGWGLYAGNGGKYNCAIPNYFNFCDFTTSHSWDKSLFTPDYVVINLGTNDYATYRWSIAQDKATQDKFINDFIAKYNGFIGEIKDAYGDVPIIIMSDMMYIYDVISSAIDDVCDNNTNCYRLKSNCQSLGGILPAGHPNQKMNQYAAEELVASIEFLSEL